MAYNDKRRGRKRGTREDGDSFGGGYDSFGGGNGGFGDGGFDRQGGGGGFRSPFGGGHARNSNPGIIVGSAQGKVKFFNSERGFGFIVRDDGGEDVFLHVSALEEIGLKNVAENQPVEFNLRERNGKVSAADVQIVGEILPVEEHARAPREDRPRRDYGDRGDRGGDRGDRGDRGEGGFGRRPRPAPVTDGQRYEGTVKFFNAQRGYGFIQRDDGNPDAFVHISAVESAGLSDLAENQRLSFELEESRRGKQAAVNLELL